MPKIRQYTANITPSGATNVRNASAADFGGLEADALMDLGQSAQKMEDKLREVQERREQSEYERMMAEHKLELAKKSVELSQAEFAPDADLSQVYGEEYKGLNEQLAPHVPVSQRRRFEVDSARLSAEFQINGLQDGVKRQALHAATNFEQTMQAVENRIALDPSDASVVDGIASAINQLDAIPTKNEAEREAILAEAHDRIMKATVTARIFNAKTEGEVDQFLADVEAGEYADVPDLAGFIAKAKDHKKDLRKLAEKNMVAQTQATLKAQLENEAAFTESLTSDEPMDFAALKLQIDTAEIQGGVRKTWAVAARRVLASKEALAGTTVSSVYSGFVMQMHDLLAMPDSRAADFMEARSDLSAAMLDAVSEGKLLPADYKKLDNQFTTLLSKHTAESTRRVVRSFGAARKMIEKQVPLHLQGTVIREVFDAMEDQRKLERDDRQDKRSLEAAYLTKTKEIITRVQNEARAATAAELESFQTPLEEDDYTFMEENAIDENELEAEAARYGMSPKQLLDRIKAGK